MPRRLLTTELLLCHAYLLQGGYTMLCNWRNKSRLLNNLIAPESYFKKLVGEGCRQF